MKLDGGAAFASLVVCALSACSEVDVCATYPGRSCIAVTLGADQEVDFDQVALFSIELELSDARTPTSRGSLRRLPATFALLPTAEFVGEFSLDIGVYRDGRLIVARTTSGELREVGEHVAIAVALGRPLDPPISGADGGSVTSDAGTIESDAGIEDPAPADRACNLFNTWSETTKPDPACADRKVLQLTLTPVLAGPVSIARTPLGLIAVAYFAGDGQSRFGSFVNTFDEAAPTANHMVPELASSSTSVVGRQLALTVNNTEAFQLAYTVEQPDDTALWFSEITPSTTGMHENTGSISPSARSLDFLFDSSGVPYIGYFDAAIPAKVRVRHPAQGPGWTDSVVETSGVAGSPQAREHVALDVSLDGVVIAASMQKVQMSAGARPLVTYATGLGMSFGFDGWPIANLQGTAAYVGYDVSLAHSATRQYAGYFAWPNVDGQTAQYVVTEWLESVPMFIRNIPVVSSISDSASSPRGAARIGIDRWNILHVVYADVSAGGISIFYSRRKVDAPVGQPWITDTIVQGFPDVVSSVPLDMVVSRGGRVHLVYALGGHVFYATRMDRQ